MKKISLAAIASLIALSSAAFAQTIDINSMPLGNIPTKNLDMSETGSVTKDKVLMRKVKVNGETVTQYYKVAKDGSTVVISQE
jgi:ribosome-associated protein YbcJ (S4-like RNA binding protein)